MGTRPAIAAEAPTSLLAMSLLHASGTVSSEQRRSMWV